MIPLSLAVLVLAVNVLETLPLIGIILLIFLSISTMTIWRLIDLTDLNHLMGFMIHVINTPSITLHIYGKPIHNWWTDITLYSGWNMVGYPSNYENERDLASGPWINFDTDVDTVMWYDAETGQWCDLYRGDSFEIGQGYYFNYTGSKGSTAIWAVPNFKKY